MQKLIPVNYLEKRCMQVKFYSTYNVVNGEEGFFLKVGRLESKVLTLEYLGA